jgi:Holliday junction resolvase
MKKIALIITVLCSITISFAQRANLDREYIKVSYVQLPSNPILDDAKRTFSTNSSAVTVAGFSKVSYNGTLNLNYRTHGTMVSNMKIDKTKHEKKDKDGHVTSVRYTYVARADYKTSATLTIDNAATGEHYKKNYSKHTSYRSSTFDSYSKASNFFYNNKYSIKRDKGSKHRSQLAADARNHVNNNYGYPVKNSNELIWILGYKKHPDYSSHHDAFNKLKSAFSKMRYNQPVNTIAQELSGVIKYFEDIIPKYTGSKKKMRKMRYASYYALSKIYYFLDMPEKAKAYGQKLVDNDYDKKDGRRFIRKSDDLIKRFNANNTTTRHFDVLTEDLTQVNYNQVTEDRVNDKVIAYLITKANDTIEANISTANIARINYGVDLTITDAQGKTMTSHFKAEDSKTLALTNEDVYHVVEFTEAKKGANASALKFVKTLFESDKIALYSFDNKELVLKKSSSAKGTSTKSSAFVFGFNKKLGSYCADCPSLLERTKRKEFKNTEESLLAFCKAYSECQ